MCVNELMELAEEIDTMPLTEAFKEQMMIQAADLIRFKEAYAGNLKIIMPFAGPFSIVEVKGRRVALNFCAFKDMVSLPLMAGRFSHTTDAAECWLILVNDCAAAPLHDISAFCADGQLLKSFSRIFILNFSKSSLHQL
ncbi:MAG: hypothetical protein ACLGH8_16750 [Bacteroidia bacterium]